MALRFVALIAVAVVSVAVSVLVGYGDLNDAGLRPVLLELRSYRVATAFGVGACLAVSGVLIQGMFRNALASPSILGISSGASLGGQLAMLSYSGATVLGISVAVAPEMLLPLGCVLGSLAALGLLILITRNRSDSMTLLLCGFLLTSLFVSLGAFVTTLGQQTWELGRAMVAFTLGGVAGAGPRQAALIMAIALIGTASARTWADPLDVLMTGEEEAESLGVDTRVLKRWCVLWTAILSGAAVAVGGTIGFVGLIVPHVTRTFVGLSNRRLVPAAALAGGSFVVLCDLIARALSGQGELPLGVITGIIGAPTFLFLLLRSRYLEESRDS